MAVNLLLLLQQTRDPEIFAALWREYEHLARWIAERELEHKVSRDHVDDVVAQVFEELQAKISPSLPLPYWCQSRAWLKGAICRRTRWRARDIARKEATFATFLPLDESRDVVDHQSLEDKYEEQQLLNTLLKKLPRYQRTAIQLHRLEGLTCEEIADIMPRTTAQVRTLLGKAMENLKNEKKRLEAARAKKKKRE